MNSTPMWTVSDVPPPASPDGTAEMMIQAPNGTIPRKGASVTRSTVILLAMATLAPRCLSADVVLDESGEFTVDSQNEVIQLDFTIDDVEKALELDTKVTLTAGKVNGRIIAPDGKTLSDHGTTGSMTIGGQPVRLHGRTGDFQVQVVPQDALGSWSVRVALTPAPPPVTLSVVAIVPGVGMMLVGVVAVLWWRQRSGAEWRWFWMGAAVWTVGVVLKFAWAIPLNAPILAAIEAVVPHNAYLILGGIYIGLLTGVFEIGITLLAALIWKNMSRNAASGVAVAVGAGAFEAILLGVIAAAINVAALMVGGEFAEQVHRDTASSAGPTSLIWLVGPIERVIAVLCHVSSRALVLLGVARGRWRWPFFWGFMIMTALDSVAGYAHLAGLPGKVSAWWIELALAPAALASVPVIVWCIRSWPGQGITAPDESAGGASRGS